MDEGRVIDGNLDKRALNGVPKGGNGSGNQLQGWGFVRQQL